MFGIEQAYAMTSGEEAAAAGIIAGGIMTILLLAIAFWILVIIARWKIFTKAGEKGWKSIIPIYSDYVQWRLSWKKLGLFWVMLALVIVGCILASMGGAYTVDSFGNVTAASSVSNPVLAGIGSIMIIVGAIMSLVAVYKMMCAFGHGGGWLVLYIFFPNIMLLVLGFGSSQYLGPQD